MDSKMTQLCAAYQGTYFKFNAGQVEGFKMEKDISSKHQFKK